MFGWSDRRAGKIRSNSVTYDIASYYSVPYGRLLSHVAKTRTLQAPVDSYRERGESDSPEDDCFCQLSRKGAAAAKSLAGSSARAKHRNAIPKRRGCVAFLRARFSRDFALILSQPFAEGWGSRREISMPMKRIPNRTVMLSPSLLLCAFCSLILKLLSNLRWLL